MHLLGELENSFDKAWQELQPFGVGSEQVAHDGSQVKDWHELGAVPDSSKLIGGQVKQSLVPGPEQVSQVLSHVKEPQVLGAWPAKISPGLQVKHPFARGLQQVLHDVSQMKGAHAAGAIPESWCIRAHAVHCVAPGATQAVQVGSQIGVHVFMLPLVVML